VTPELEEDLRELDAQKAEGRGVCAGLTGPQFNWRPAPGSWSVAECLKHLSVAMTATLPRFDQAIERGRAHGRTAPGPFRYSWFAKMMIRSMEPPPRWRMKTQRVFDVPAGVVHAMTHVLPEFVATCDQLGERVRRSDGLDLRRVRVVSPASSLLRMPLGAYFRFVIVHNNRHLWQARQVRAAPGFGTVL
jgi:DinB superfamily